MMNKILQIVGKKLNIFLKLFGLELRPSFAQGLYLSKNVINEAQLKGLSLCDYVEQKYGRVGKTKAIVDELSDYLKEGMRVVEIGAGTGRHAQKIMERVNVSSYEIYEFDDFWKKYLRKIWKHNLGVIVHNADGFSLSFTSSNSVDLVCAFGIFVYLKHMVTFRYLDEAIRVLKQGGQLVFDIYDMDNPDEDVHIEKNIYPPSFPTLLSLSHLIRWLGKKGMVLEKIFRKAHGNGISTYCVFRKRKGVG